MMRKIKTFSVVAATVALCISCMSDKDSYQAGFSILYPSAGVLSAYANNLHDSLIVFSYGDWAVSASSGWASLSQTKGSAGYSAIGVTMKENTTREMRQAVFQLKDVAHADDAYNNFYVIQYATRGNGSYGSAAEVKNITGTDGTEMTFAYDNLHRPLSFILKKDGEVLRSLNLRYNDKDSIITIDDTGKAYRSAFDKGYLPVYMTSESDTMGYSGQGYTNANLCFNFDHLRAEPSENTRLRYVYGNDFQGLSVDGQNSVDSICFFKGGKPMMQWKVNYSNNDNRYQSIDVNQLLMGIDEMDPYLLLSLYRFCRQTSIISSLNDSDAQNDVKVTTELNSDKSVAKMSVERRGQIVDYTFGY